MATYPLNLPSNKIARISIRARSAVAVAASPFTFKQQVYRHQGEMLEADITLPPMRREQAEAWVSFLLSLRGQYGTFLMGDPIASQPRGSASTVPGSPVVNGRGQVGDELAIGGLPANVIGYLLAGDYIQLGSGATSTLHKVLGDVDTDALGQATIPVFPRIRTSPTSGSPVAVSGAVGKWRLASNETNWDISVVGYGITFGAVEAI